MPYRWIEDITRADAAFEATGADLPEVFRAAWNATLEVMLPGGPPHGGAPPRRHTLRARDAETLLHTLLEWVVYVKDAEGALAAPAELSVREVGVGEGLELAVTALHVPVESVQGCLGTDVKAVTMHRFGLVRSEAGWKATVVLDV